MEEKDEGIKGAEGIVLHNGKIILGMQKAERWYKLPNGESAAIIKTIGGKIEIEDENSSKKALVREVLEEIRGIEKSDIRISQNPIFTKRVRMKEVNPFERESNLKMNADFYALFLMNKGKLHPNDLPALIEIPVSRFLKLKFGSTEHISTIQDCIIQNDNVELPENYALMIPREIKMIFEEIRGDLENVR